MINDHHIPEHINTLNEGEAYDTLQKSSQQRSIEDITNDILRHKHRIVNSYIQIGRLLIEAKEQLENGHGSWLRWLSDSVEISARMAQRYMQLAKMYSNTTAISDLSMTKALALLALDEDQREDFIKEPHEIDGKSKTVAEMSTRELKRAIRGKNESDKKSVASCTVRNTEDNTPQIFHPIRRYEYSPPKESDNLLDKFNANLKSAKKQLNDIRVFFEENPMNFSDEVADDLRTLLEQVQQCIRLAGMEVTSNQK